MTEKEIDAIIEAIDRIIAAQITKHNNLHLKTKEKEIL